VSRLKDVLILGGALSLVFLLATTAAAQGTLGSEGLQAEIPFAFVVDGQTMPAGTYSIEIGPGKDSAPVLAIQTERSSGDEMRFKKVMTLAQPGDIAEGQPRLVFKQVGDMYFLEKVVPNTGTAKVVR